MENKFLIIGLGNPGDNYRRTRHNYGFFILDQIAKKYSLKFYEKKFGFISKLIYNKKLLFLLKPSTYVNQSGKSVIFWIKKKKFY